MFFLDISNQKKLTSGLMDPLELFNTVFNTIAFRSVFKSSHVVSYIFN